jgi:hypothetical protein
MLSETLVTQFPAIFAAPAANGGIKHGRRARLILTLRGFL